jgi:origin recognition complex subunit 5
VLLAVLLGRQAHATDLLFILTVAPVFPVQVHGGAATGKTSALVLALRVRRNGGERGAGLRGLEAGLAVVEGVDEDGQLLPVGGGRGRRAASPGRRR